MITPESINLASLPWLPLEAKSAFPRQPAIYFAIDAADNIQYIGRSVNPKHRWANHHRYDELSEIGQIRIAYLFVDAAELLPEIESALIAWFDPPLNGLSREPDKFAQVSQPIPGMKWRLPVMMADREMDYKTLAAATGLHPGTISKLKNNLPDRLDMKTLSKLCKALGCQPGDLLVYIKGEGDD